jgi:hypothetical protein
VRSLSSEMALTIPALYDILNVGWFAERNERRRRVVSFMALEAVQFQLHPATDKCSKQIHPSETALPLNLRYHPFSISIDDIVFCQSVSL